MRRELEDEVRSEVAAGRAIIPAANIVLVRKLAAMEQEIDINQGPEGQTVQAILDKIASDVGALKTSKAEN